MQVATRDQGPRTEANGSRTITVTSTPEPTPASTSDTGETTTASTSSAGVLRLRGGPTRRQHVAWSTDTVDNEGMGKKKSKSEINWHCTALEQH
jgi:protein phosphatase 1 regulatory subunit 11